MKEVFVDSTTTAKLVCGEDIAIVLNYEMQIGAPICVGDPIGRDLSPERDSEMGLPQFNLSPVHSTIKGSRQNIFYCI